MPDHPTEEETLGFFLRTVTRGMNMITANKTTVCVQSTEGTKHIIEKANPHSIDWKSGNPVTEADAVILPFLLTSKSPLAILLITRDATRRTLNPPMIYVAHGEAHHNYNLVVHNCAEAVKVAWKPPTRDADGNSIERSPSQIIEIGHIPSSESKHAPAIGQLVKLFFSITGRDAGLPAYADFTGTPNCQNIRTHRCRHTARVRRGTVS
jgi:hypothetical protein